ncbi:hypothetical protein MTR67_047345 [Solanum verrucosum]|uniref:Pentatricopeptide repeat-containing protein n=1 Tax=Solanum verrucosum TaxID=315347 RepID=A0AAF0ZYI7_SOLVR|nr:hypothetical protein MTR67_047345 [Solanum verrucosum]
MGRRPQMIATYNSLIDLYRKAGRFKDAADVLNEMLKSDFGRCTYVIEQEDLRAEINRLKDELAQENKMECEELPVNGT